MASLGIDIPLGACDCCILVIGRDSQLLLHWIEEVLVNCLGFSIDFKFFLFLYDRLLRLWLLDDRFAYLFL